MFTTHATGFCRSRCISDGFRTAGPGIGNFSCCPLRCPHRQISEVAFGELPSDAATHATAAAPTALPVVFCEGAGLLGLCGAVGSSGLKLLAAKAKFFATALFLDVEGALLAFGVSDLAKSVHARGVALGLGAGTGT